jgi:hypothetical protein
LRAGNVITSTCSIQSSRPARTPARNDARSAALRPLPLTTRIRETSAAPAPSVVFGEGDPSAEPWPDGQSAAKHSLFWLPVKLCRSSGPPRWVGPSVSSREAPASPGAGVVRADPGRIPRPSPKARERGACAPRRGFFELTTAPTRCAARTAGRRWIAAPATTSCHRARRRARSLHTSTERPVRLRAARAARGRLPRPCAAGSAAPSSWKQVREPLAFGGGCERRHRGPASKCRVLSCGERLTC